MCVQCAGGRVFDWRKRTQMSLGGDAGGDGSGGEVGPLLIDFPIPPAMHRLRNCRCIGLCCQIPDKLTSRVNSANILETSGQSMERSGTQGFQRIGWWIARSIPMSGSVYQDIEVDDLFRSPECKKYATPTHSEGRERGTRTNAVKFAMHSFRLKPESENRVSDVSAPSDIKLV